MNVMARLLRKLRAYLHDLEQSRADLTDNVREETAPRPIPPGDGKRHQ